MADASGQSKLREKVSVEQIVGIFGLATAFSTVLSEIALFPGGSVLFNEVPVSALIAFTMAASYLFISKFQERLATSMRPILLIFEAIGFVSACACAAVFPFAPKGALCVLCAISAFGAACLVCSSFCWVCTQDYAKAPLIVAECCFFACLACLIESLLKGVASVAMICVVYGLSVGAAYIIRSRGATDNQFPCISNAESDSRSKIMLESTVKFSIDSFMFGLLTSIACSCAVEPFCLAIGCLVGCALFIDGTTRKKITERTLSMYAPPLIAASVCGLFLFGDYVRIGALCVIAVLFMSATCVGWMAMVGHVLMSRLSSLRIFTKARRIQYLAVLLGLLAGTFLFKLSQIDWVFAVRISVVLAVVLVFVFSILHKSRFPEIGLDGTTVVGAKRKGAWLKRCQALSEKNGLSERQAEVLVLIAQGRSAKYVEQELSISLSTAQTHIRNIYRKVGVHSRQELLDEIEATKLYGED